MHISNISSNTNLSQLAKVDTTEESAFSINSTVSSDSILNYYQQLCSQYPDITFVLMILKLPVNNPMYILDIRIA